MGPPTLLNSLVRQIVGVPNGTDISVISGRRHVGVGILEQKWLVLLSGVTRGMVAFCLMRTLPGLCVRSQSPECSRSQGGRTHSQDTPSGNCGIHHLVFLLVTHRVFPQSMVKSTIF